MRPPPIVAIDGAGGSGKSTLARALARELGLPYINTGWMYRALAAVAVRSNVLPTDAETLLELMESLRFTLEGTDPVELEVEGYDHDELTSVEVEETVPAVAGHAEVRKRMIAKQRDIGKEG